MRIKYSAMSVHEEMFLLVPQMWSIECVKELFSNFFWKLGTSVLYNVVICYN